MTRLALTVLALILWPPVAGAVCLFLINGLGDSGAFTYASRDAANRSLWLAAREGFMVGVNAAPFISLTPAAVVFGARRYWPKLRSDILTGAMGGGVVMAAFIVWTAVFPLDPLLGGIMPIVLAVLLISGAISGFLIASLRPRTNPTTSPP